VLAMPTLSTVLLKVPNAAMKNLVSSVLMAMLPFSIIFTVFPRTNSLRPVLSDAPKSARRFVRSIHVVARVCTVLHPHLCHLYVSSVNRYPKRLAVGYFCQLNMQIQRHLSFTTPLHASVANPNRKSLTSLLSLASCLDHFWQPVARMRRNSI
jgi:hypothetical protein